jgi:transposase
VFRQAQPGRYAAGLAQALSPVLEQIAQMTLKVKQYDRQILELTQTEYTGQRDQDS